MPELATEAMTIEFTPMTGQVMGTTDVNDLGVTHIPSTKAAAKDEKICVNQLVFAFSAVMVPPRPCPCQFPGYNFIAGGGTLIAASQTATSDNMPILVKGDMGTCSGSWQQSSTPFSVMPCSCQVKISDAGQTGITG